MRYDFKKFTSTRSPFTTQQSQKYVQRWEPPSSLSVAHSLVNSGGDGREGKGRERERGEGRERTTRASYVARTGYQASFVARRHKRGQATRLALAERGLDLLESVLELSGAERGVRVEVAGVFSRQRVEVLLLALQQPRPQPFLQLLVRLERVAHLLEQADLVDQTGDGPDDEINGFSCRTVLACEAALC